MKHFTRRARGFTLIEILVVLSIATLLGSILFAAFKSVSAGNKKASCQNNLVQIYQATRLYGQDFNGELPYLNPGVITNNPNNDAPPNGMGLWALYAYPKSNSLDCDGLTSQLPNPNDSTDAAAPLGAYIKSPKFFHCPYDQFEKTPPTTATACQAPGTLQSDVLQYTGSDGNSHFNPFYLSYQGLGAGIALTPYSSFREPDSKRQLVYYETNASDINRSVRISDTTVITWCRFHRALDANGNTVNKESNFDNVLFADGTVQYIPTTQKVNGVDLQGGARLPLEVADCLNSGRTDCHQ